MGVAPFMEMAQDLLQQLAEPLPQGPWSFRAGEAGRLPAPVVVL